MFIVAWKQHVIRDVTEPNTDRWKCHKCVRLPDSGGVLDSSCGSHSATLLSLSFDGTSVNALWICVLPYIPLHMNIVPIVIPWSICICPRKSLHLLKEWQNQLIVRFTNLLPSQSFFRSGKSFGPGVWGSSRFLQRIRSHLLQSCSNIQIGAAALSAPMMLLYCSFPSAFSTSRNLSSFTVRISWPFKF